MGATCRSRIARLLLACAASVSASAAQETGAIRGRLVLARGVRLSSAELAASEIALDRVTADALVRPDLSFELRGIAPGEHTLAVRLPEFEPFEQRVTVRAGETLALELPLVLGIVVEGRVIDQHGEHVPAALVTVTSSTSERREVREERTRNGHFRIAGLRAGHFTVTARRERYGECTLELGALPPSGCRDDLVLRLEAQGTVAGVVRGPQGKPARHVRVFVQSEEESEERTRHRGTTRTDAEGRFALRGVGTGPFHVKTHALGEGDALLVASARHVAPDTPLALRLAPAATVDIVVLGMAPGDGSTCGVADAEGRETWHEFDLVEEFVPHVAAFAVPGGNRVNGLEPGSYGLHVTSDDTKRAAWVLVEVRAGERKRVEVELQPATEVVVRAFEDGVEVEAAFTVVAASGQRMRSYRGCIDGGMPGERMNLPPGAYVVHAECEGRTGSTPVALAGEAEREVRVELR